MSRLRMDDLQFHHRSRRDRLLTSLLTSWLRPLAMVTGVEWLDLIPGPPPSDESIFVSTEGERMPGGAGSTLRTNLPSPPQVHTAAPPLRSATSTGLD